MKSTRCVPIVAVAAFLACSSEPAAIEPEVRSGVFAEGPCPVPVPEGLVEGESIRCGTVAVPEFHGAPDGKTLLLQVAVFPSVGESPTAEPLFVATAGPGASGIESITPEVAGPLGPVLLAQRDLVLIDYRGLPLAEPNLMCPEIVGPAFDDLGEALSAEAFMERQLARAAECRDRLRGEGVALEAFNNAETAADIALVMTALGYEKFHVYGTSAGTILAQYLLRDFPDRLRSVVIDSTVPAGRGNVHTEAPGVAAGALAAVIELCEADPACAAAYPNLRQEAGSLVERYDREPVTVAVTHPETGEPAELVLTGHRVAQGLLMLNSQTPTVPMMPWFIHRLASGDTSILEDLLWTIAPPGGRFSWALGTSIFCMEYGGFTEDEIVFPGIFPAYEAAVTTQSFGGVTIARTCDMWGVEPIDPELRRPVSSDVPVLLVAGEVDSLTPPAWAEEVAAGLTNAHLVVVPGYAHSPTFAGECTAGLALQFMADPTVAPDTTCVTELRPAFVGPEGP